MPDDIVPDENPNESPCIKCGSMQFGCECSSYRFWRAEVAGRNFRRDTAAAARHIRERDHLHHHDG